MPTPEGRPTADDPLEPRDESAWEDIGFRDTRRTADLRLQQERPASSARPRTVRPGARNPHGWGPQEHVYNPASDPAAQPLTGEAASQQAEIDRRGATAAREVIASTESASDRARRQSIARTPRLTREVDAAEARREAIERLGQKPTLGALRASRLREDPDSLPPHIREETERVVASWATQDADEQVGQEPANPAHDQHGGLELE